MKQTEQMINSAHGWRCIPKPAAAVVMGLCLAVFLSACRETGPATATPADASPYSRTFGSPPLTVEVRLHSTEITVAEQLQLAVAVTMPEGYTVEFPRPGTRLGEFAVTDSRISQPRLTDSGSLLEKRSYLLEPFLSGDYTIPPLEIRFRKQNKEDHHLQTVATEAIPITVRSLFPQPTADLAIQDIVPPLELPRGPVVWFWATGSILLLMACGLAYWFHCRRHEQAGPPPLAPHHEALQALEKLLASDLLAKGEVKIFHSRVSGILRYYLEKRFGLKAPERTTEEFLAQLSRTDILKREQKLLLRGFLTHCDLVKFARHRPGEEESEQTVTLCRQFVEETAKVMEEPDGGMQEDRQS